MPFRKLFYNIFFLLGSLFVLELLISYFLLRYSLLSELRNNLTNFTQRVIQDIHIDGQNWNMDQYLADPNTPHPNGSSGFQDPLYIITNDGFVIERNAPISGFLDASDYKHFLSFTSPQYVKSVTNEQWRVLSEPVQEKGIVQGVISVALYNPQVLDEPSIDILLRQTLAKLKQGTRIINGTVDTSAIDIRTIQYDVSFEIVDKYNTVLLNNGRTPAFIDPSYVHQLLTYSERVIEDKEHNSKFLVKIVPLKDSNGTVQGAVLMGQSLVRMNRIVWQFLLMRIILMGSLIIPLTITIEKISRTLIKKYLTSELTQSNLPNYPSRIQFNKRESRLRIDNQDIAIPYASNQYYLCEALFANPKKRWESDELLERFGESLNKKNIRSVYDAAVALNKKFSWKLVDYQGKTYRLNPVLRSRLVVDSP